MSEDRVEAERRQIEQEIKGRTLCDLLADHAAGHGDAPAMSWKRDGAWQTLSWREYRERVAEVAMGLAGLGVGKGDFVAIMATNRPEHVLADQGAVHAGATPSSFYFTLAPEQIQYVAGHCEAKVAVLEDRDMLKRWQDIRDGLPASSTWCCWTAPRTATALGCSAGTSWSAGAATRWPPTVPRSRSCAAGSAPRTTPPCCTPPAPPARPRACS